MVRAFVVLNPHLSITLDWDDQRVVDWSTPTTPDWRKWRPSDAIPASWYSAQQLQRLIAAQVNRNQESSKRVRLVQDFVGDFRGLSGTAKRSAVLAECELARAPLDTFFSADQVDHASISRLLEVMKRHSRPVKPEALGLIGEAHFRRVFSVHGHADHLFFQYAKRLGEDDQGRPFIAEAAFTPTPEAFSNPVTLGINWSPAIRDPFRSIGTRGESLSSVLADQHVHLPYSRILVGVHLVCPVVQFVDRGKSAASISEEQGEAIIEAVHKVTKDWASAFEKGSARIIGSGGQRSRQKRIRRRKTAPRRGDSKGG